MIDTIRTPMNRTPSVVPGTVSSMSARQWARKRPNEAVSRPGVGREANNSFMGRMLAVYHGPEVRVSGLPDRVPSIFENCDFYPLIQDEIYYNCAAYHMNRRYGIVILAARVEFTYNLTLGILHKVSTLETL